MKLSEVPLKKNQVVTVVEFSGPELVIERLHELGFHKGCELRILGRAPLGGPLLVELDTTVLALRKEESQCLLIQL